MKGVQVLRKYFVAMSAADLPEILKFLSDDVKVGFCDKSRNWSGRDTAQEKFGMMYERSPGFRVVDYTVQEESYENGVCNLLVNITFVADGKEAWNSTLFYEIDEAEDTILSIAHK